MSEATALVGLKSLRLSFELVASGGDEQETDKDTVQFVFPLNNTDTIAATFALADEGTTLNFLLEHNGQPQEAEESFPRYGGHVTFRSSAIPGSCYREPFRENPDQASTSAFVALDTRSASSHLYFIVDLLLKEQGSEEEGQELVSLFGNPASYPNNNDDSPYGNSDNSDDPGDSEDSGNYGSSEYWSETSDDEDQYVTDQKEDVPVEPEKQKILDEAQRFFEEQYSYGTWRMWVQMQRDKTKPTEEGVEPAAKKTPKPNPKNEPFKEKNENNHQDNKDADSGDLPQSWGDLDSGTATTVQTMPPPEGDISKILATMAKSAVLKSSKTLPEPSSEPSYKQQGRNAKRTYEDVEDDDGDDESSSLSRDGRYAFKKQRQ